MAPAQPRLSSDMVRLCQRLHKLDRGKIYTIVLVVPEQQERQMTWTIAGEGKIENEG